MLNHFLSKLSTLFITTTVVSCSLIFPETSQAFKLFSIETNSDSLVSIDPETGQVDLIGTLGLDFINVDLANIGNQLFALNFQPNVRVDLLEINPFNASIISSAQVTNGGTPIIRAEGLTNIQNELLIGFSSNNGDGSSESLGALAFNGNITNVRSTSSSNDFDALGGNDMTGVVSIDGNLNLNDNIFGINLNTGGASFITSISPSVADGVNDLIVMNNNIFAISAVTPKLLKFSTSGVLLETIDLSQPGTYFGLAVDNTDTISVPESSNFWGLGIFSLLGIFALKRSQK